MQYFGSGRTEEQTLSIILGSSEYFNRVAPLVVGGGATASAQTFVRALYIDLLKRQADPNGLAFWTQQTQQFGPQAVAFSFLRLSEYRVLQVQSYYVTLLRHSSPPPANDGGVQFWANQSGLDLLAIRIQFEATPEFYQVWVNFNGAP